MKTIINIIIFSVIILTSNTAQQKISADEIIQLVNDNQDVNYENVLIDGDLDFTKLDNMTKHKNGNNYNEYISYVESKIIFKNCVFTGNVIAHECFDNLKTSYVAHFKGDISFSGCTFKLESTFKHSKFMGRVDFANTVFNREANFKHASFANAALFQSCVFKFEGNFKHTNFSTDAKFQNSIFEGEGNFKHVHFPSQANFNNTVFNRGADFKHATFSKGVDFANAQFLGYSDFKHTCFHEPVQLNGVAFKGEADFEHTKIGNKSFVNYLLQSKK